jgi:hypothetical protein
MIQIPERSKNTRKEQVKSNEWEAGKTREHSKVKEERRFEKQRVGSR